MRAARPLVTCALVALALSPLSCNYQIPEWQSCCTCECEGCDVQPARIFAPMGDTVECWDECDAACGALDVAGCGGAEGVAGCPTELCVEYVGLGEACDGALDQSGAPVEVCTYYFRECEHPDWTCTGGICQES